jgi:hypothetical protein
MPYFLRLGWPVAVKKQLGLSGDSIDGNSDDPGHRGWFDIDAFSFGNPRAPCLRMALAGRERLILTRSVSRDRQTA